MHTCDTEFIGCCAGPPEPPTAPQSPQHTALTPTSFTAQWTTPTSDGGLPLRNYTVEIRDQGNTFCPGTFAWTVAVAGVDPTARVATVTDLLPAYVYQYRVRAFNYEFSSPWSSTNTLTTPQTGK